MQSDKLRQSPGFRRRSTNSIGCILKICRHPKTDCSRVHSVLSGDSQDENGGNSKKYCSRLSCADSSLVRPAARTFLSIESIRPGYAYSGLKQPLQQVLGVSFDTQNAPHDPSKQYPRGRWDQPRNHARKPPSEKKSKKNSKGC